MSDFARAAVLQNAQSSRMRADTLRGDLVSISRKLADLDALLSDVHKRIRRVLGPVVPKRKDYNLDDQRKL